MQAGDYNERFLVQSVSYSIDGDGDQVPKYKTVYAGYAKVLNLNGTEYWEAYSVHRENTKKFHCRWDEHLRDLDTTRHVLKWRGKLLDIVAIDNIENRNAICTIKAIERDSHD